jgi:AcrR family transcriptional regulator
LAQVPRKKSPRQSKELRTAAILQAARAVFEERGYEKATMAEIAERIGVVEGTVFHYFSSKRKLVLAVMEAFYETIILKQAEGLAQVEGTRARLHFVIREHLKMMNDNAAFCAVILRESRGLNAALSGDIKQHNRYYTDTLNKIIRSGIDSGELAPNINIKLVRNTVYGSIEHALWNWVADEKAIEVDKLAEQLTQLVYSGIANRGDALSKSDLAVVLAKLNALVD